MKRALIYVSNFGVSAGLPENQARSIRLTNQLALVAALTSTFYLLFEVIVWNRGIPSDQKWSVFLMQGCTIFFSSIVILLNYLGRTTASRVIVSLVPLTLLPNAFLLDRPLRAEFYMYGMAAASFVFFLRPGVIFAMFLIPVTVFFLMIWNLAQNYPQLYHFDAGTIVRISISFMMIYIVMNLFRKENQRYEDEIKKRNEILTLQGQELKESNATKNKILSVVGHDLRGPIGSLHTMLQMLNQSQLTQQEFEQLIKDMTIKVGSLHYTLENLLQWSSTQTDKLRVTREQFAINEIANEMINLFRFQAENKSISLQLYSCGESLVFADVTMIRSVILNLFSNCLKFTHSGGTIDIRIEDQEDLVRFSIKDSGVGMTPKKLQTLFTQGEYSSMPGTSNEAGMGLGLFLCKEFLEYHETSIEVESEVGRGTTFSFTLPKS